MIMNDVSELSESLSLQPDKNITNFIKRNLIPDPVSYTIQSTYSGVYFLIHIAKLNSNFNFD